MLKLRRLHGVQPGNPTWKKCSVRIGGSVRGRKGGSSSGVGETKPLHSSEETA